MIKITKVNASGGPDIIKVVEGTCLHNDQKPTDWPENSILLELDTGDFYYFSNNTWSKVGGAGA